jgi:hypothetical protein
MSTIIHVFKCTEKTTSKTWARNKQLIIKQNWKSADKEKNLNNIINYLMWLAKYYR